MNKTFKYIAIVPVSIFILNSMIMMNKVSLSSASDDSLHIPHQEIMNDKPNWNRIDVPAQRSSVLPDGRKIYYENGTDIADCKGRDPRNIDIFGNLPNVKSVSYLSDGNTLNATFWLSKIPLINHSWQDKSELSKIDQVFLLIDSFDASKYEGKSLAQMIIDEGNNIKRQYPDLDITNSTNSTDIVKISNESSAE